MGNTGFIHIEDIAVRICQIVRNTMLIQTVRVFRLLTPQIYHVLGERFGLIAVAHPFIHILHIAGIVGDYVVWLVQALERNITGIVDFHPAGLTGLGGNQDYTVCCT